MARLLMIIGVFIVGGMLLRRLLDSGIFGPRTTYRPRQRPFGGAKPTNADAATFLVSRAELTGLRDSFSAEPIDPSRDLMRCPGCQSFYHLDSVIHSMLFQCFSIMII